MFFLLKFVECLTSFGNSTLNSSTCFNLMNSMTYSKNATLKYSTKQIIWSYQLQHLLEKLSFSNYLLWNLWVKERPNACILHQLRVFAMKNLTHGEKSLCRLCKLCNWQVILWTWVLNSLEMLIFMSLLPKKLITYQGKISIFLKNLTYFWLTKFTCLTWKIEAPFSKQ